MGVISELVHLKCLVAPVETVSVPCEWGPVHLGVQGGGCSINEAKIHLFIFGEK